MKYENKSKHKDCKCETNNYWRRHGEILWLPAAILAYLQHGNFLNVRPSIRLKRNQTESVIIEMFPNVSIVINIDFLGAQQRLVWLWGNISKTSSSLPVAGVPASHSHSHSLASVCANVNSTPASQQTAMTPALMASLSAVSASCSSGARRWLARLGGPTGYCRSTGWTLGWSSDTEAGARGSVSASTARAAFLTSYSTWRRRLSTSNYVSSWRTNYIHDGKNIHLSSQHWMFKRYLLNFNFAFSFLTYSSPCRRQHFLCP